MSTLNLKDATEAIYTSLANENDDLDQRILALKIVLKAQDMKSVEIDQTKIPQPNRQGRKMMESYFKKRGVIVTFSELKAAGAA